ncbi:hypothetical protein A1A1_01328 [Planococcus antarcticus DSM 14505]|uniref:Uncharacterized protein n=1 Tax=Planococcus antarcticus DSM 14505 TaxID=1185653 RepID=A0AA87IPG5_9BACL|nr:hypothetical protein [Planococcus antarcticus]EIM08331.1 hypothetical protein A1A1_01328 [Planococcus antarcticus DSM 14505]
MKKKNTIIVLSLAVMYFFIRLSMKIASIEKNYTFVINEADLETVLVYVDVAFVLIFFIVMYIYFKNVLAMKYITIALAVFFIPFTIVLSVLNPFLNNEQSRSFIGLNEEHLLIINHVKGLHPDEADPREVYLFEKKNPFTYKKVGQSVLRTKSSSLTDQPILKFELGEPIIEIGEVKLHFE